MNRSILIALSFGLIATPALAQQPLQPAPTYPQPQAYGQPAQPQYDPNAQPPPQPMDPYAQYGESDDEDDQMDVTYDISTDPQEQQYDDGYDPNAYQQFESELSPYGSWQDVPTYGRVWVPSTSVVGYDFEPYATGGHWVDSEYGWTWDSDWDWGWAPFHYGRWMIMGGYGWCWMPGTTWGPAWVDWRWGGGYVGWAPMGPRGVVIGPPRGRRSPWHFTVANQLANSRPHYLPSRVVASVWRSTTPIHNVSTVRLGNAQVRFNAGPPARLVAATTGRAIAPVSLRSVAPRALPSQAIAPRVGTPMQQRPWMQQPRAFGAGTIARAPHTLGSQPIYSRPGTATIQARPQPLQYRSPAPQQYRAPAPQPYRAYGYGAPYQRNGTLQVYRSNGMPAQSYHPAPMYHYGTPAQAYHPAPQYHYGAPAAAQSYHPAPAYHYAAPAQSFHAAPAQSFHAAPSYQSSGPAPSFHSAPAQSFHPSGGFSGGGGGFHGGFSGGGFHGGGRR